MSEGVSGALLALIQDLLEKSAKGYAVWFGFNGSDMLFGFSVGEYLRRNIPVRAGTLAAARAELRRDFSEKSKIE